MLAHADLLSEVQTQVHVVVTLWVFDLVMENFAWHPNVLLSYRVMHVPIFDVDGL